MTKLNTARLRSLTLKACIATSILAIAPKSWTVENITPEETALLPEWCLYTAGFPKNSDKVLIRQYGQDFGHMHHHCWGLISVMRAERFGVSIVRRNQILQYSLREFDYVLRSTQKSFPFRFETMRAKASVLQRLGKHSGTLEVGRLMLDEFPSAADSYIVTASALYALGREQDAQAIFDTARQRVGDLEYLENTRRALLTDRSLRPNRKTD